MTKFGLSISRVRPEGYKRFAMRQFVILMLTTVVAVTGVTFSCAGMRHCTMPSMAQMMNCCRGKDGLSAPGCCSGNQQLAKAVAIKSDRATEYSLRASGAHVVAGTLALTGSARRFATHRVGARAAPPDATLFAQHTSLLL